MRVLAQAILEAARWTKLRMTLESLCLVSFRDGRVQSLAAALSHIAQFHLSYKTDTSVGRSLNMQLPCCLFSDSCAVTTRSQEIDISGPVHTPLSF